MGIDELLAKLRKLKPQAAAAYKAREMGLFGSFARGEQDAGSDIDVLVDFDESADLFDLTGLALYLEEQLQRKVDVVPKRALREELRESVGPSRGRICLIRPCRAELIVPFYRSQENNGSSPKLIVLQQDFRFDSFVLLQPGLTMRLVGDAVSFEMIFNQVDRLVGVEPRPGKRRTQQPQRHVQRQLGNLLFQVPLRMSL